MNPDALHNALQKAEVTIYENSVGENAFGDSWPKGAFPAGDTNVSTCAVGTLHILVKRLIIHEFIFITG